MRTLTCAKCLHPTSLDYVNMADQCPRCQQSPFTETTSDQEGLTR